MDAADAPKTDELKAGVDIRPAPVQVGRFFPMICWVFGTSPGGCLEFLNHQQYELRVYFELAGV